MRWLCALLLTCTTAAAADDCFVGSVEPLRVVDWSATPIEGDTFDLTVTLEVDLESDVRMIDAQVFFADALGGSIGGAVVPRDSAIPASGEWSTTWTFGRLTSLGRLATLAPEDVEAIACTRGAVLADGTVRKFD